MTKQTTQHEEIHEESFQRYECPLVREIRLREEEQEAMAQDYRETCATFNHYPSAINLEEAVRPKFNTKKKTKKGLLSKLGKAAAGIALVASMHLPFMRTAYADESADSTKDATPNNAQEAPAEPQLTPAEALMAKWVDRKAKHEKAQTAQNRFIDREQAMQDLLQDLRVLYPFAVKARQLPTAEGRSKAKVYFHEEAHDIAREAYKFENFYPGFITPTFKGWYRLHTGGLTFPTEQALEKLVEQPAQPVETPVETPNATQTQKKYKEVADPKWNFNIQYVLRHQDVRDGEKIESPARGWRAELGKEVNGFTRVYVFGEQDLDARVSKIDNEDVYANAHSKRKTLGAGVELFTPLGDRDYSKWEGSLALEALSAHENMVSDWEDRQSGATMHKDTNTSAKGIGANVSVKYHFNPYTALDLNLGRRWLDGFDESYNTQESTTYGLGVSFKFGPGSKLVKKRVVRPW